jgi:hypothetical protein
VPTWMIHVLLISALLFLALMVFLIHQLVWKEKAGSEGEFRPGCTHINVHYGELAGGGESFGCTRIGRYSGSRVTKHLR